MSENDDWADIGGGSGKEKCEAFSTTLMPLGCLLSEISQPDGQGETRHVFRPVMTESIFSTPI